MDTHRLALVALSACVTGTPQDTTDDTDGVAACAWERGAHAGAIAGANPLTGPAVTGQAGDVLLANPHAAFVIQGGTPTGFSDHSYVYYGGTPLDAVAMEGCEQAGPERFGELTFLPAKLEITDFTSSAMRMLRGKTVRVVSDGADGGPAIVQVDAIDDAFWLVDLELTRRAAASGGRRPLAAPMGIEVTVTYTLAPDAAALAIDVTVKNTTDALNTLAMGAALFPDASTPTFHFADSTLNFGGFGLELGVPWFVASGGDGAYAYGLDQGKLAVTEVSGVRALLDPEQLTSGTLSLQPAGQSGDTATVRSWLAVGPTDEDSAVRALLDARPRIGTDPVERQAVSGAVTGAGSDEPVVGAVVDLQVEVAAGSWRALHRAQSGPDGRYAIDAATAIGDTRARRLVARIDGRPESEPVAWTGEPGVDLPLLPGGWVQVHGTDGEGGDLPVRATFVPVSGRAVVRDILPEGQRVPLVPGAYTVAVTRGYEHEPWQGELTVVAGESVALDAELPHVVNTDGWISLDTHVHSGPSPDSDVPPAVRFGTAATAGLDLVNHSEHEIIVNQQGALAASPWAGWVGSIAGQEVTATTPEHMNMVGVPVGPEDGPRGRPVPWYQLGMGGVIAGMDARGAGFHTLNHPRGNCGWMCQIDWDGLNAEPRETDPTRFGLPEGTALWSWDLAGVELMNGHKYLFFETEQPRYYGLFDDWIGFWQHGHRVTGVASSDVHGLDGTADVRTYVKVDDDDPATFSEDAVVAGLVAAEAVLSAGAFLRVDVDGVGPGGTVTTGETTVDVHVRVEAPAAVHVSRAVVFFGCRAIAELPATGPDAVLKLDATLTVDVDGDDLLVVLAFGDEPMPLGLDPAPLYSPRALSNPVLINADGNSTWDPPGARACSYEGFVPARI